jgi:hypothetical protein
LTGLKPNASKALQGMTGLEAGASYVLGSPQERATSEASLTVSEPPAEEELSPALWENGEHFVKEDVATAAQTFLRAMAKRWFQKHSEVRCQRNHLRAGGTAGTQYASKSF